MHCHSLVNIDVMVPLMKAWNQEGRIAHMETIPGFDQIGKMPWYPGKTFRGVITLWKIARELDLRVLSEYSGDWFEIGEEYAEKGLLGPRNIFNHCTGVPQRIWSLFAEAGVNVTTNPRSDVLFGFDDETFAYQQAIDNDLKPAIGIDLDTAFGSDMFGEMQALFGLQRSVMGGRRYRGEADAPAPISVEAVLEAATVNGARVMGLV